jgi:hypothetical protein
VEDDLVEEKNEGSELAKLKKDIIEAASNRLVFLVGLESNRVGFEIRSLQEFMAAEGLMDGRDEIVQERLKEVAPSTNWRNVFLFAAGKCFTDRRHLRDTIESICLDLNDDPDNPEYRQLGVGSMLALELLEDGPARRQPIKRRSMTRLALQVLGQGPQTSIRLASVWLPETTDIFIEEIRNRIRTADEGLRRDVWLCLAMLIDRHGNNFEDLGKSVAPTYEFSSYDLDLIANEITGNNEWLSTLLFERTVATGSILDSNEVFDSDEHAPIDQFGPWKVADKPTWFSWYVNYCMREPGTDHSRFTVAVRSGSSTIIRVSRLFGLKKATTVRYLMPPEDFPTHPPTWRWIASAGAFCSDPNAGTLARSLTLFNDSHVNDEIGPYRLFEYPWPLAECLLALDENPGTDISDLIRSGDFGDYQTWLSHEDSWQRSGITFEALCSALPLLEAGSTEIFQFPFRAALSARLETTDPEKIVSSLEGISRPLVRTFLMRVALNSLGPARRPSVAPDWVDHLLYELQRKSGFFYTTFFEYASALSLSDRKWSDLFMQFPLDVIYMRYRSRDWTLAGRKLYETWKEDPSLEGLLVPLAGCLGAGGEPIRLDSRIEPSHTEVSSVRAAALLLNLYSGNSARELSDEILWLLDQNANLVLDLIEVIYGADFSCERERRLLLDLQEIVKASGGTLGDLVFSRNYSRRRSRIGGSRVLERLGFPLSLRDILHSNRNTGSNSG